MFAVITASTLISGKSGLLNSSLPGPGADGAHEPAQSSTIGKILDRTALLSNAESRNWLYLSGGPHNASRRPILPTANYAAFPSHRPTGPAVGRPEDGLQPVPIAEMGPGLRREDRELLPGLSQSR